MQIAIVWKSLELYCDYSKIFANICKLQLSESHLNYIAFTVKYLQIFANCNSLQVTGTIYAYSKIFANICKYLQIAIVWKSLELYCAYSKIFANICKLQLSESHFNYITLTVKYLQIFANIWKLHLSESYLNYITLIVKYWKIFSNCNCLKDTWNILRLQ